MLTDYGKRIALMVLVVLPIALFGMTSCSSAQENIAPSDVSNWTGGYHDKIFRETGSVVEVNRASLVVLMDDSSIHAGEELLFDFSRTMPYALNECHEGDKVEVEYFDQKSSDGSYGGEALTLA